MFTRRRPAQTRFGMLEIGNELTDMNFLNCVQAGAA